MLTGHTASPLSRRLISDELSEWLQEYTLGELWQKNVLGDVPSNEHTPDLSRKGAMAFVTRLNVVVEGQTEESFVRNVLAEVLWGSNVHPTPILSGRLDIKEVGPVTPA